MDVAENLSTAKKNEIQHLMHMVQLVGILPECICIKLCWKWTNKQNTFLFIGWSVCTIWVF